MEEAMPPTPESGTHPMLTGERGLTTPLVIRNILITCGWLGAIVALLAWVAIDGRWALGFAAGTLIGAANLYLLSALGRRIMNPEKKNIARIVVLLTIKVGGVYGALAALLLWDVPPALAVICGFSIVLLVITLKAVGRALHGKGFFSPREGASGMGNGRGEP